MLILAFLTVGTASAKCKKMKCKPLVEYHGNAIRVEGVEVPLPNNESVTLAKGEVDPETLHVPTDRVKELDATAVRYCEAVNAARKDEACMDMLMQYAEHIEELNHVLFEQPGSSVSPKEGRTGYSLTGTCEANTACSTDNVCLDGACEPVFSVRYELTFKGAEVASVQGMDSSWDPFGGAPDPLIRLYTDDQLTCEIQHRQDDFYPQWNQSCEVKVDQGSSITIVMVDADPEDSLVTMTPVLGEAGLGGEHIVEFQYTGSALSDFLRHDEAFAISANGTTLNVAVEAQ